MNSIELQSRVNMAMMKAFDRLGRESGGLSFFELLELCKKEDAELAVQSDLGQVDIAIPLFYALFDEWMRMYDRDVFYVSSHAQVCCSIIHHLFEHEDFISVFHTMTDIFHLFGVLSHYEAKHFSLLDTAMFKRIKEAICLHCQVSFKK